MTKRRTVLKGSMVLMVALATGCSTSPASTGNVASNAAQLNGAGLISNNAGGLISNNAGGLISNNAGGLISNNAGGLVSNNAGGLISNNAGGLISNNAGGLISNNAGGLISNNAGGLTGTVRGPAAGLISNNAGGLISNNAGGLISNNAGGLISNNAGGLISNNAGGLISNNAGGYHVLADADAGVSDDGLTQPIAGAKVACFDEHGEQISYAWTTTDEKGNYTFTRLKGSGPIVFVKAVYEREGKQVVLVSTAPAPRKPGLVNVTLSPATSIVAKKLGEMIRRGAVSVATVHASSVDKITQEVAAVMSPKAVVAAAILPAADVASTFDNMVKESPTLAAQVASTGASEGIAAAVGVTPPDNGAPPAASGGSNVTPDAATNNTSTTTDNGSGNNTSTNTNTNTSSGTQNTASNSGGQSGGQTGTTPTDTSTPTPAPTPAAPTTHSDLKSTLGTLGRLDNTARIDMPTGGSSFTAAMTSAITTGSLSSLVATLTFTNDTNTAAKSVSFDGSTAYYLVGNTVVVNGNATTIDGAGPDELTDIAASGGIAYVSSASQNIIYKVDTNAGTSVVFAGEKSNIGSYHEGVGTSAAFNSPQGLCVTGGNLYVADAFNTRIRKVAADGTVSTLAGSVYGSVDGTGTSAAFRQPMDITTDGAGNLYVVDENDQDVRQISLADASVTLIAGNPDLGTEADGTGNKAAFKFPTSITYGKVGGTPVLVVGQLNRKVRIVSGW